MTARGERVRGEQGRGPLTLAEAVPSQPPPAHPAPSLLDELAGRVHVAIAFQRRLLDCGDTIEPWWKELCWDEIDRRLDDLDAHLPAERSRL